MTHLTRSEAERLLEPLGQAGDTVAAYVFDVGSKLDDGGHESLAVAEALDQLTTAERAVWRARDHLTEAVVDGSWAPDL